MRPQSTSLSEASIVIAPDGATIRILPVLAGGSMVHVELGAGMISRSVAHRTVEELWYILSGNGQMWRKLGDEEVIIDLVPGVALTIPLGTHFQYRAGSDAPLTAVITTMPAWPGEEEAFQVPGPWTPTV